jgi:acyl carrier protein
VNHRKKLALLVLLSLLGTAVNCAAADRLAVADRVRAELATLLKKDAAKLPPDTPVLELGADDLTIVEWTMALDEAFGISIPDEKTTNLKNRKTRQDLTISVMTQAVSEELAKKGR